jgi:hypothetical protein
MSVMVDTSCHRNVYNSRSDIVGSSGIYGGNAYHPIIKSSPAIATPRAMQRWTIEILPASVDVAMVLCVVCSQGLLCLRFELNSSCSEHDRNTKDLVKNSLFSASQLTVLGCYCWWCWWCDDRYTRLDRIGKRVKSIYSSRRGQKCSTVCEWD